MRSAFAIILTLLSGTAFLHAQEAEPKIIEYTADIMRPIKVADSSVLNLLGNVVLHHNGAVITCDSAIRYNDRRMECFKRVVINSETTYVYGDRADYDGNINLATVYAPIVKMVDQDAVLYTYNFTFNTLDNIGQYSGGGTMTQNDNLLESQRGYYYVDTRDLIGVEDVEMRNPDYQMKSDSVVYNMNTEIATFYTKSWIWNSKGEILSAEHGSYETQTADYRFTRDAYILTADQEVWADSIDYNTQTDIAILRQDVQIRDEEQKIMAFGDYGEYWGQFENALLTRNAQLVTFDPEQDSLYMRADSMFFYTFPYEYDFSTEPMPEVLVPGRSGAEQLLALTMEPEPDQGSVFEGADSLGMGGIAGFEEIAAVPVAGDGLSEEEGPPLEENQAGVDSENVSGVDRDPEGEIALEVSQGDEEEDTGELAESVSGTEPPEEQDSGEDTEQASRPALSKKEQRRLEKAEKQADKERRRQNRGTVISEEGRDDRELNGIAITQPEEDANPDEIVTNNSVVNQEALAGVVSSDAEIVPAPEPEQEQMLIIETVPVDGNGDEWVWDTEPEENAGEEADGDDNSAFLESYYPVDSLERIVLPVDSLGIPVFPVDSLGIPVFPTDSLGMPLLPVDSLGNVVIPRDSLGAPLIALDSTGMPLIPMDSLGRPTVPGPPPVVEPEVPQDSLQRVILGYRNVRIYRVDFQAVADSTIGFSKDSTLHLFIDPVLWNEQNQIVSDVMDIYTKNEKLHKAVFTGSPFMSSEVDPLRYNQIKGKLMEAYFRDNEIYKHDVIGNAETYYYMEDDETGDLMGFLVAESADITFLIDDRQMDQIIYRGNPEYVIYPMDKIPLDQDQFLPGFKWEAARRPSLGQVFDRTIRPSEREAYELLPQPEFPLTQHIEEDKQRKSESGVWIDRNDTLSPIAVEFVRSLQMGDIF